MALQGIVWHGVSQFESKLKQVVDSRNESARKSVAEGALLIQNQAKRNASGRPGPNVITGRLRSSIAVEGPQKAIGGWRARIGPRVIYARSVELGNPRWRSGSTFPFLRPAIEQVRGVLLEVFRRNWSK